MSPRPSLDRRLVELPSIVVMSPEWLEMDECAVPREGDLEAAFARILLGTPCLPDDTPNPEMVQLP